MDGGPAEVERRQAAAVNNGLFFKSIRPVRFLWSEECRAASPWRDSRADAGDTSGTLYQLRGL